MMWKADISVWLEKPSAIQVFSDDGQEQDYVPERTCSPTGEWESISQTQAVRHVFCSACGHEFGMDRKDTIPFERTRLVGLPYYCSECGARVARKVVER